MNKKNTNDVRTSCVVKTEGQSIRKIYQFQYRSEAKRLLRSTNFKHRIPFSVSTFFSILLFCSRFANSASMRHIQLPVTVSQIFHSFPAHQNPRKALQINRLIHLLLTHERNNLYISHSLPHSITHTHTHTSVSMNSRLHI